MAEENAANDPLASVELLAGLAPAERIKLARECNFQNFSSGQTIVDKDDKDRDVLLIVKGRVEVTRFSISGKEISLEEIPEGKYFGEFSAIDGEPRSATVIAAANCTLAHVSPALFRRMMESHPGIAWEVLVQLTRIIRVSNERIMDLATLTSYQLVCSEILRLTEPDAATKGAWSIYPLPRQSDIARRIGTSRETVGRVIRDLIDGGVVSKKGRSVFIPNLEKLELMVQRLGPSV